MTDSIYECTKIRSEAREIIFHDRNFTLTIISTKNRKGSKQKRFTFCGEKRKKQPSDFPSGHYTVVGRRMDLVLIRYRTGHFNSLAELLP